MTTAKKTTSKVSKKVIKKMVAKQNRQVAKLNKAFEALSPSEKRVYIARDVLAQIALKKLIPATGVWLTGKTSSLVKERDLKSDPELQDIIAKTKQCEGCAMGGLFMSAVCIADELRVSELEGVKSFQTDREIDKTFGYSLTPFTDGGDVEHGDAFKYLKRFFTRDQLVKIEAAFEQNGGSECDYEAGEFAPETQDPTERMTLIMQNIIVNKGTFKPLKQPVAVWTMPGFAG